MLFVVPTPWTATGDLTVRVTQGGVVQANTTLALNDRVGNRLTGGDVVAEEEMEIILATDWRSLVHPTGSGTGGLTTVATDDTITGDGTSGDPLSVAISWGFQLDTVIVPELNQDAITDARIVLADSALTHYLEFVDWTQANLDMISHLPVGWRTSVSSRPPYACPASGGDVGCDERPVSGHQRQCGRPVGGGERYCY